MNKYDALFEDENDIFGGTPVSKYWDIAGQSHVEVFRDEFDMMVRKLATMEVMLSETYDYETMDKTIKSYAFEHQDQIEDLTKSTYMDLAGKLIYRQGD